MLFHIDMLQGVSFIDWFRVIWNGLPMDLSMAGYIMIIPGIFYIISVFMINYQKVNQKVYFLIIAIIIATIFIPDLHLYSFWGFRIDATVFAYLGSPKEVVASVSWQETVLFLLLIMIWSAVQFFVLKKLIINRLPNRPSSKKIVVAPVMFVLLGLTFIPIRGGLTASTMNPGYVYFSENMFLNHTALNPVFNMLYSLNHQKNFGKQFRFMDDETACAIVNDLMACNRQDSTPQLLTTARPNVIFIILESFGAKVLEPLGGISNVTPNLSKLSEEGIFFRQMYANSFRTDRGIVSVLGGYPAQPNMSILKYASKVQTLDGIPKSLIDNGYKASFMYGGDLNFAQMELFAVTQKITDITDLSKFPSDKRTGKWGVPDEFTFEKLADEIENEKNEPFMKILLTLSSHEPFDVPTNKFDEPYLNSVAYTDSCLGIFINKIKRSPLWNNSLIILVPDHDMRFPKNIDHFSPERHDIFMLWLGGAVKNPAVIDNICTQADIAATLLNQLNIPANKFTFSRNILNPSVKEFAFYTFPNGFGMISPTGKIAFDCDSNAPVFSEGELNDSLVVKGKALLQCLYDDIQRR
ncbi:MAG: sulfatase-like hydrolase/transferase [Dysgonamonadaceae bacterium]|nr:sulfatase-like hydrolase/transferase [Dysgonamonadaceae bacterium]